MTMGLSEGISPSPAPPLPVGPPSGAPMDEEGQPGPSGGPPRTPRDEDTCSEASSMSTDELMSPAEKLQAAINLKDEGNALFKEGQYEQALERYKAGVKHVKGSQDSDAIAVSVQLSSNSCMCCLKLERWQQAITAANQVLATEPKNPKALYRRAVAKSNLGELSDAKDDLMAVIAIDKANAEARKELQKIREKIQAAKAEDKKAYSGLFSRASGLYDDREEARERRKKEEEAERARKRAEWEKDMAARKEKGEQEEEFETWLEKKKEAEEKEREEKQKQQAKLNTPEGGLQRRKNKSDSSSSSSSSSSVMELDEEDAAIVQETKKMGYCYFRRDLTEEEKRLNAQNKPTKIASPTPSPQSAGAAGGEPEKSPEGKSISQWNAKGTTYEEKDVSPWARTRFAERLQEASAECGGSSIASPEALIEVCRKATEAIKDGGLKDETAMKELFKGCLSTKVETTSVGEVSGDAHLAVVRGSRRVFFDMKCSVKFNISCSSGGALGLPPESSALSESLGSYESKGTLTLPDVSSADGSGMSWLQGSSVSLNKAPSPLFKPVVDEALQKYKESIAEKIQAFLDDCKALP